MMQTMKKMQKTLTIIITKANAMTTTNKKSMKTQPIILKIRMKK